jgi:hypothetical protein
MRFMVIVKGNQEYEAGAMPAEAELAEMGRFNEELIKAGVMLVGEGLHNSSKAVRLAFGTGEKPRIIDGPFTEAKELVAGFWIIQVKSKEEAIEWMSRAPFRKNEVIELRQIFEAEDFGPELTAEMRERDARLRAQTGAKT